MKKITTLVLSVALFSGIFCQSAFATSASRSTSACNGKLTSDVWIQSMSDHDGTGEFQVAAKYSGTKPRYANWIKTQWEFYSVGVGAGITWSGITANVSGSGHSTGSYWKNTNSRSASFRGRVSGNGLCLYVGCTNTATMFAW
ncbi:hypothetical protein G8S49_12925, partial [Clostridium botulinum C]